MGGQHPHTPHTHRYPHAAHPAHTSLPARPPQPAERGCDARQTWGPADGCHLDTPLPGPWCGGGVSHFPTGGNRIPGSRAPTGCNAKGWGPVVPVPPWVLGPAHAPEPGQPWGRFRYNRGATEGTAARSEPPRLQLSTALSGMVLGTGEGKARRPAWVLGEARGGRSPTSPQMWQLKWGSRQAAKFSRRQ